jgi:inner membrane protein
VDNLTHTLTGAVIGELVRPATASSRARVVFAVTGMAAANLPDADLAYTAITAAPLGYLLHHRGHTHTLPGLMGLGLLLAVLLQMWSAFRESWKTHRRRLCLLIGASLVSHLLLDAANSYGTHLLYPLSNAWFYGDAVFILEPWAWLLLGIPVARSSRRTALRVAVWALVFAAPVTLAVAGLLQVPVVLMLLVAGLLLSILAARIDTRPLAAAALCAVALLFAALIVASDAAKSVVGEHLPPEERTRTVDIVANANPGAPWCWLVLAVSTDAERETLSARRGSVSLLPAVQPAASCPSHQLTASDMPVPASSTALVWSGHWQQDLNELRRLAADDCWTSAWLQFGRVPFVEDGQIVDLRFDNPLRFNFSAMPVQGGMPCPGRLTNWQPPRLDVLESQP